MSRFELESQISNILTTVDDLRLIADNTEENKELIRATADLLEMKYAAIFDTFKKAFKLDEYNL